MRDPRSRRRPGRRRRGLLWIALLATALVALSTVSVTPPLVWRLEDAAGKPLRGAWAAYHFLSDLTWSPPSSTPSYHGSSPRTAPLEPYFWRTLSPAERAEHEAAIAADLAREPLWWPYAERTRRDRVVELAARVAER